MERSDDVRNYLAEMRAMAGYVTYIQTDRQTLLHSFPLEALPPYLNIKMLKYKIKTKTISQKSNILGSMN